ncbi:MAG: calcineurin-like phosphoesterase family protein [Alistipes sp.]|nr:calcineurin-like phosphoesterase family protein [Alistipes sp.]
MNSVGKKIFSLILSVAIVFGIASCGPDPVGGGDDQTTTLVTNVVAPSSMVVTAGKTHNIQAAGANKDTDVLVLSNAEHTYECEVTAVTSKYVQFRVPGDFVEGTYTFTLRRGEQTQELFTVKVQVQSVDTTVKDKAGNTLKGMVYCGGVGVEGVLVSDGVKFTKTDANGHYWLNSDKRYEVVYITLPKGYDVKSKSALPAFWAQTSSDANSSVQEQHNFELVKNTTNENHTVLVVTDIHIANLGRLPNDYVQFNQGWKAEVKKDYNGKSNVYCLNLGDFAWDVHWYASKYAIPEAAAEVSDLPFQYWSTMGNHDNDGHAQGESNDVVDMLASRPYRQNLGPTHYSLNIGDVHYIMLDDILYRNSYPGETEGDPLMGMRDYRAGFREDMMEWLQQDLSYVSKDTPILVGMHIPVCNWNGSGYNGEFASSTQWQEFLGLFSAFNEVEFISGHTHVNRMRSIPNFGTNMYEHNIAAICGIWWHTSQYTGGTTSKLGALNLCADGSPAGYYIYDVQGKSRSWRFKAVGAHKDKQFKSYDMNEVKKYFTANTDAASYVTTGVAGNINTTSGKITVTKASLGLEEPENMVWLNVWGHETGDFVSYGDWTITVKENGKTLNVEKITGYRDPLAVACYDVPQLAKSSQLGNSRASNNQTHLFRVQATSATSTLDITVKDRFGNTYTETMKRPKRFYTNSSSDVWTLE